MKIENEELKKEVAVSKSKISSFENKYNILFQEKNEYEAANHRQRSRLISLQNESESLRNERDSMQNQLQSLKVNFHFFFFRICEYIQITMTFKGGNFCIEICRFIK